MTNTDRWASIATLGSQILALGKTREAGGGLSASLDHVAGFSREYGYSCITVLADATALNVFRGPHVKENQKFARFRFVPAVQQAAVNFDWTAVSLAAGSAACPGIQAGSTGSSSRHDSDKPEMESSNEVPEYSFFVICGLEALVLGAAGLYRWRAARGFNGSDGSNSSGLKVAL